MEQEELTEEEYELEFGRMEVIPVEKKPERTLCSHIKDPVLIEWYKGNPENICARCWLGMK